MKRMLSSLITYTTILLMAPFFALGVAYSVVHFGFLGGFRAINTVLGFLERRGSQGTARR